MVVERARALPVLIVITHRPQFSPQWSGQAHVTALPLHRLGRRQGAAMALRVTGGKALPAEILDQILERTDGVPLFLEELTRTMLESGLMTDAGDHYELTGPLPPLAIPANLHDSLMARLDRLATVKELAQIGAVIGREFSHELLAAVADRSQEQLESGLDQLVASELVFRRGSPPDAAYSFKHALVKDVAYQSLLKSRRQQLHARVAQVFEARFPGCRRNPTRAARLSPDRSRARRARGGRMGAGRSRGPRPLGDARGGELALSGRRTAPGNAVLASIDSASSSSCSAASASLSPIRSARGLPKLRRRTSARVSFRRNWATARASFARAGTFGASTTCALNSIQRSRQATRSWRRPKRTATPITRCRRTMRCGRRVCFAAIWRRPVTTRTAGSPSTRSIAMVRRR